MRNIPTNGVLFIASAMAITVATSSLFLISALFVLDITNIPVAWSALPNHFFGGTEMAIFAGTLLFFIVSVVRCFSGRTRPFSELLGLMFIAGTLYWMVPGALGFVVLLAVEITFHASWPFWLIGPIGFLLLVFARATLRDR